jgi:glutamate dehydrogenase (NAD(P)+)
MRDWTFDIPADPAPVTGRLVIDSVCGGTAAGGLRMRAGVSTEELRLLAADMTLKYGLLGIPQGGAKAGIDFDPEAPAEVRRGVFEGFGRAAASLLRTRAYIPGMDMGTSQADIDAVLRAAERPPAKIPLPGPGSGYYTGLSVVLAARAGLAVLGRKIEGARVAIEGFGKVGSAAAFFFAARGARIVAVSTKEGVIAAPGGFDVGALLRAASGGPAFVKTFPGAAHLSEAELKGLEADVLCPCALGRSLDETNWRLIRASVVSSGANSALAPAAGEYLHTRGVIVVPDFIANCGGVLGTYLQIAGFGPGRVVEVIPGLLDPILAELLRESAKSGESPMTIARPAVGRRFEDLKRRVESKEARGRILRYGTVRRLRSLLPPSIARALGLAYFRRALRPPVFGLRQDRL